MLIFSDQHWMVIAYLHDGSTDESRYSDEYEARRELAICRQATDLYKRVTLTTRTMPWSPWSEVEA